MSHSAVFKGLSLSVLLAALLLTGCGNESPRGASNSSSDVATSDSGATADVDFDQIRSRLGQLGEVSDVSSTPWPGVYAVVLDGREVHTNADGSLILVGDMYRAADQTNLTDQRRSVRRRDALKTLGEDDSIDFAPEGETRHVVWVFTDVDCGYCQRLHQQMAEYNALGIEVRYLPYPRAGEGSESWRLAEQIWCADDRKRLLTQAKLSRNSVSKDFGKQCDSGAVARGHKLGEKMGLRGTPMIVNEQGLTVGGYVPPAELAKVLDSAG